MSLDGAGHQHGPDVTPSTMYTDWVARSTQRRSERSTRDPQLRYPGAGA